MKKNILIVGINNYSNRRIKKEIELLGHKAKIINPNKLNIFISDNEKGDRIYYDKKRIYRSTVDAIIPRIGSGLNYAAASIEHIEKNIGIFSTSSASGLLNASNKSKSIQLFSRARLRVPKTMYIKSSKNFKWMIDKLGGFPIVAKLIRGSQGVGTFILNDELAASTALETITSLKKHVLLQNFITTAKENEQACDIRIIVVNGEVVGGYKRYAVKGGFRSNFSISKLGKKVKLTDAQKEMALNAASAVGLKVAGVDIAYDIENELNYIYEINGNMSLAGFEKVTGLNAAKAIAEYAIQESKDTVFSKNGADELTMFDIVDESGISIDDPYEVDDIIDDIVDGGESNIDSTNGTKEFSSIIEKSHTRKDIELMVNGEGDFMNKIVPVDKNKGRTWLNNPIHKKVVNTEKNETDNSGKAWLNNPINRRVAKFFKPKK